MKRLFLLIAILALVCWANHFSLAYYKGHIESGQYLSGSLNTNSPDGNPQDLYDFYAKPGEIIIIRLSRAVNTPCPTFTLYDPNNNLISPYVSPYRTNEYWLTNITIQGWYSYTLDHVPDPDNVEPYNTSMLRFPNVPLSYADLDLGQLQIGTSKQGIMNGADLDSATFAISNRCLIKFKVAQVSVPMAPNFYLFDPYGNFLAIDEPPEYRAEGSAIVTNYGMYTLVIGDKNPYFYDSSVNYAVTYVKIPGKIEGTDPDFGWISNAVVRTGTMNLPGDLDMAYFNVVSGDVVNVIMQKIDVDMDPNLEFYDSNGTLLVATNDILEDIAFFTNYPITSNGTYYLVCKDAEDRYNVQYSLVMWFEAGSPSLMPVPAAPTNLVASDGSTGAVFLTWQAADTNSWGYYIYRATNSVVPDTPVGETNALSFIDTNCAPGILYYYWVKGTNRAHISEASPSDTGYRLLDPPAIMEASDGTFTNGIAVYWTNSLNATSYLLYRTLTPAFQNPTLLVATSSTNYFDTSVTGGVAYYYWVRASNSLCASYLSASNLGFAQLSPPGNVSAIDGAFTNKIDVSWSGQSAASHYLIYRFDTNSGATSLVGTATITTYSDFAVTSGIFFTYWIVASNSLCTSSWSQSDSGYAAFGEVAGVSASDGAYSNLVRITWSAFTPVPDAYLIYRNTTNSILTASLIASTVSTVYDDSSATPGVTYYYWVRTTNSGMYGAFSSPDSGYRGISPPAALQASSGLYTDKVRIGWNAASGASSYQIFRNTNNNYSGLSPIATTTTTNYDDTAAPIGITLYYWIKSVGANGVPSVFSVSATGYRAVPTPAAPAASQGIFTDKIVISWSTCEGIVSYLLWRSTSPDTNTAELLTSTSSTSFEDTNAQPDTRYYYWLSYQTLLGSSPLSTAADGYRKLIAPSSISATDGTLGGKVYISWSSVSGAKNYILLRNTSSSSSSASNIAITTSTGYNDTSVVQNRTYYYWVKASGNLSTSDLSSYDSGWAKPLSQGNTSDNDFNGNGYSEATVFNGAAGLWQSYDLEAGILASYYFGSAGDWPLGGDFDGDGISDRAVFIPSLAALEFVRSSDGFHNRITIGSSASRPVHADYNGDGKTDPATYDESSGLWTIAILSGFTWNYYTLSFGGAGYVPLATDFDGDGKADFAVFNQSLGGLWKIRLSGDNYQIIQFYFGGAGMKPVRADFDGDSKADPALYSEALGKWYLLPSSMSYQLVTISFGGMGTLPVSGDFDGDGKADFVVYNVSSGLWQVLLSSLNYTLVSGYFGGAGFVPVPYNP